MGNCKEKAEEKDDAFAKRPDGTSKAKKTESR